jgi:predicted phosphate transport protein (TIGR00153 family)
MGNIFHWLLPKEEKFFQMLKEQCSNVVEGGKEFKSLIYDYNKLSYSNKRKLVKKIEGIEDKGDDLTHNIIGTLDKTFVTPIDKEDIHRLAELLDDVIDLINKTSKRLFFFKIMRIDSHIKNLTNIAVEIINKIDYGIMEISKLKNMQKFYIDVHTLENEGDDVYHNALAKLFDKKDPIEIIKYREIYDFLENILNKCEDIANVIESIVVKHA